MSWDGYIDHLMVDLPSGKLTTSAIVGQDGGMWAQAPGFPEVTAEQVAALMTGFASMEKSGHAGELGGKGILLGDQKFQVVPGDESVLRGKSQGGGVCVKKVCACCVYSTRPSLSHETCTCVHTVVRHQPSAHARLRRTLPACLAHLCAHDTAQPAAGTCAHACSPPRCTWL
jgi:Profilin